MDRDNASGSVLPNVSWGIARKLCVSIRPSVCQRFKSELKSERQALWMTQPVFALLHTFSRACVRLFAPSAPTNRSYSTEPAALAWLAPSCSAVRLDFSGAVPKTADRLRVASQERWSRWGLVLSWASRKAYPESKRV